MQKLTLSSIEQGSGYVVYSFKCDFAVTTAGDGLWGCEAGRNINVEGISIVHNASDDELYTQVNVAHNSTWDIYTDSGFECAISDAVGFAVTFTEQGMQEDGFASLEV